MIASVIGISFLPQPFYAIGQVVIYASLVAGIAAKLRNCLRLTQGSEYLSKIHGIVLWVVLGVFPVVGHLGDLFTTENRDYVTLAMNVSVYLALFYALELVEKLLKRATTETSASAAAVYPAGATSTSNA
jgi:hypothetical protein